MSESPRVRLHYTRDVIQHTPESLALLSKFTLRALACSLREDIVVIPGNADPEELPLLNELGLGPAPGNVHADLSRLCGSEILPFSGTSGELRRMAEAAGCEVNAPGLETCWVANDKGYLYRLCGSDPAACLPQGWVCRPEEVGKAVSRLHALGKTARVKATRSASGLNQVRIAPGEPTALPDDCEPAPEEYVVQEEVPRAFDASVQFLAGKDGTVRFPAVTGQHIRGEGSHFGNDFPCGLPDPLIRRMLDAAGRILGALVQDCGYFGAGSVDFVGDADDGQVYALEVNARVTAAFYPMMASLRLFTEVRPFDMRSFSIPKGVTAAELAAHFKPVLLRREEGAGFVPFNLLPDEGFAYGMAFARGPHELARLRADIERLKEELSA